MPRRSRSMAPVRSSRSATRVVRRVSCSAASSSARRLTPPSCSRSCFRRSTRFSACSSGGSSSPSLISARSASSSGAHSSSSLDAGAQFLDARARRFPTAPGRGRVPRAPRTAPASAALACLSASASTASACGAGIAGFDCARLRRWRWRPAARCACRRSAAGTASAAASSTRQFFVAAAQFGDLAGGGGAARIPARLLRRRWRQGAGARASPSRLQAFQRGAGFAAGGAGIGGRGAGVGHVLRRDARRRPVPPARPRRLARESSARFDRLVPGGGFPLPAMASWRGALGGGAGGAGGLRPGRRSAPVRCCARHPRPARAASRAALAASLAAE